MPSEPVSPERPPIEKIEPETRETVTASVTRLEPPSSVRLRALMGRPPVPMGSLRLKVMADTGVLRGLGVTAPIEMIWSSPPGGDW